MRGRSAWQPADEGVMIYVPAQRASIHDNQGTKLNEPDTSSPDGSGQASSISDTIWPSCDNGRDVRIKSETREIRGSDLLREESPDTLTGDSITVFTPESNTSQDFVSQLAAAAGILPPETATPCLEISSSDDLLPLTDDSVDFGYDTERTDFQEDTPSPLLRRAEHRRTLRQSRHLHTASRPFKRLPVARRLSFSRSTSQAHTTVTTTRGQERGAIERKPPHNYTSDERELLAILYRFYHSEDVRVIPEVFNAITGLKLRHHIIRNYFWNHMCLYGPESFRAFGRVLSVPFDAPQDYYADIIIRIEQQAKNLELNIKRRTVDIDFVCGKARKSSSPQIRKFYKSMVEKTNQEARDEASNAMVVREVAAAAQSFGLMSRALKVPFEDHVELFTDVEQTPIRIMSTKPHLSFRVWDDSSRTAFFNGGFVAQTFVDWPRPYPAPVALDDPSGAGKILALLHLSKQGDTPVYISTASSLLQALSYATDMEHPRIASISLDASSLQGEHKVQHAADVFPFLKAQGLARWARYRGYGEYFIWSDIERDAVLHNVEVDKLIKNLNSDPECRELLNFDVFEPGVKTNAIAAILRERNKTLNTATARALGKISRAFGMGQRNMTLQHLQDFIARVLDGWTISKPDTMDMHTMSSLAATFARALGSHGAGYTLQSVMGAFMNGVDDGLRCIAHWSRSRSGSRRQRFRNA